MINPLQAIREGTDTSTSETVSNTTKTYEGPEEKAYTKKDLTASDHDTSIEDSSTSSQSPSLKSEQLSLGEEDESEPENDMVRQQTINPDER